MSLLKPSSSAHRIGSPFAFLRQQSVSPSAGPMEPAPSDSAAAQPKDNQGDELENLQRMVRSLSSQLEAAKAEIAAACTEASAEGYKKGLSEAVSQEDERSARLAEALEQGMASLDRRLDSERDLAIELTLATLASILANPDTQSALVVATATRWADTLRSSKILRVQVSAADFGNAPELTRLVEGLCKIAVDVDKSLPSGTCLFDLELGQVDASITVQAKAAEAFLLKHASRVGAVR